MNDQVLKYSFKKSLPVLFGYLFLASAVGIVLQQAGLKVWEVLIVGVVVYAGTGQFILAAFLAEGADLASVAIMTLLVNSRHMFYGLSFLDEFAQMGVKKWYMIHSMTDETYSMRCFIKNDDYDRKPEAMFWVGLFDHLYWLCGCFLGAVAGQYLPLNLAGVEFSMTALFVILFIEQWMSTKNHIPALTGLICSTVLYIALGKDKFLLPSLFISSAILILLKRKAEVLERAK